MLRYYKLLLLLLCISSVHAQQFNVNGDASALVNSCYRLTSGLPNQEGSIFTPVQIDLTQPFDLYTRIDFGFNDTLGGGGIAFSFQQFNATVVQPGGAGLGIVGTNPSLVVEFDTEETPAYNDPAYDHIALIRDGTLNHASANTIIGPTGILPSTANVETGMDHDVHIRWDPIADEFKVWVNCQLRINYSGDIVTDFFFGDPNVFWGFSASSGSSTNIQDVCIDYLNLTDGMVDTTLCEGTPYLSSAGIGNSFAWSPAAGLSSASVQSPTATPSNTTMYTVTVTDNCGITRQDSFTYTVLDSIRASISGDTFSCQGTEVPINFDFSTGAPLYNVSIFDGTNIVNFVLDSNGIDTASNEQPSFTVGANPATYSVFSISNQLGCNGSAAGTVSVNPDILNGIQTNVTEPTCNGLCNGSAEIVIPHDNGSYTYDWSNGSSGTNVIGLCAGNYQVTITNGGGCTATTAVNITEPAVLASQPINNTSICPGENATLTASVSGGVPPYAYIWNSAASTSSITVSPTNTETYVVTVTDANNCPVVVESAIVTVLPGLTGSVDQSTGACIGENVSFSAYANGGDGNYNFNWSNGANGATQNLTPDSSGVYSVTISDGCGSTPIIDSITVQIDTFPTHTYTVESPICLGRPTRFDVDNHDPNAFYLFDFGDGLVDIANTASLSHTYNAIDTFDVTLRIRTDYCDSIRTDTDLVVVQSTPRASFDVNPDNLFTISNPIGSFTSTTNNVSNWIWSIDGIRVADSESFTFDFRDSGSYEVGLIVANGAGCTDTTDQTVIVGLEFPNLFVPNTFTPNGDGINDTFGPVINARMVDNYEFLIFNRLGDLVFSTTDPQVFWNGERENAGPISGQDYFWWKLTYTDINQVNQKFEGKVTLIK